MSYDTTLYIWLLCHFKSQYSFLVLQTAEHNILVKCWSWIQVVANAMAETCWLCNLLLELHYMHVKATIIYCDNVCVVYMSFNLVHHQCTNHIEIDLHFFPYRDWFAFFSRQKSPLVMFMSFMFHLFLNMQTFLPRTFHLLCFLIFGPTWTFETLPPFNMWGDVSVSLLCIICIICI